MLKLFILIFILYKVKSYRGFERPYQHMVADWFGVALHEEFPPEKTTVFKR